MRRRHRRLAREIAREAIIRCEGDSEAALEYFRSHPRIYAIDVQTVILMIQLAIQLWAWWKSRNISEPSTVASMDEIGILGEAFFAEEPDDE